MQANALDNWPYIIQAARLQTHGEGGVAVGIDPDGGGHLGGQARGTSQTVPARQQVPQMNNLGRLPGKGGDTGLHLLPQAGPTRRGCQVDSVHGYGAPVGGSGGGGRR